MTVVGRLGRVVLSSYFAVLMVFLYTPLVVLLVFAFNKSEIPAFPLTGFTTRWFHIAFSNSELTSALSRSAQIATLNGLAATALAVLAAVGLSARRLLFRSLVITTLLLPLVVPYIVLAIGMLILLHQMGIQTTLTAVLAGHVVISLPYSILVIYPRLQSLDEAVVEAARDLGASEFVAFLRITLPLLAPALLASVLIAFTISFDEFAIASFLAPAGTPTYPIFLYAGARTPALIPEVISIGTLVIALSIALVLLAEGGRRWAEHRLES